MRWPVALIVLVGIVPAAVGSAMAATHPTTGVTFQTVTIGTVRALDLSQITVGHTTCSFASTKMEALTQNFDLDENVAIGCQRGVLKTIALAPITGSRHAVTYLRMSILPYRAPTGSSRTSSAPTPTPAPAGSGNGGLKVSFTSGELTLGGSTLAAPVTESSVSATGPITAVTQVTVIGTITGTSITVGGATCTLLGDPPFLQSVQVGTVASISCTNSSDSVLSSSGTISIPAS